MKKIYIIGVMCVMMAMSGCRKSYISPLETPNMTKAAEDKAYDLDFIQLNNDVIDELQEKKIYSFVKDLSVSGDNDKREIEVLVDIEEDVSYDAVELLLTDATKALVDGASTQDFRIEEWNEEGFGNLFDLFSYKYKVTCGDEVVIEESINAGESVPFDSSMTFEQIIG
ncbi:hypothetical protein UYO_1763 [Lachnospiraceae bacterium JC7]|nr:hypothetical protein UYO_1763 [Lachnospiraceae bacterium JC7]